VIKRAVAVSLAVLILPLVEIGIFRFWLRYGLELRLGLPGFVDYDLLLPSAFSFMLFVFILLREKPVQLEVQLPNLNLNGLFVLAFGAMSSNYRAAEMSIGTPFTQALWTGLLIAMVISAFSVWVPFSYVLGHARRWVIVPCLLMASTIVIVKHWYTSVWPWFGVASANSVCSILQSIDGVTKCAWNSPEFLSIRHPQMRLLVGPPCSGTDCLLLFLIGFTMFIAMESKTLSRSRTLFVFFAGVGFAFFLNIFRIVSIFYLSLGANSVFGSKTLGLNFFVQFFHMHAGWVLYAIGWTGFFLVVYRLKDSLLVHTPLADRSRLPSEQ
jgi:exosortase/archaeosortase family protein